LITGVAIMRRLAVRISGTRSLFGFTLAVTVLAVAGLIRDGGALP
jgi:hypothetical protein